MHHRSPETNSNSGSKQKGESFLLIDTALPEYFAAAHLPGALNACVFEVDFTDQVNALLEKAAADEPVSAYLIVVYDASERSLASADAAQKLSAKGFTNPREYRDGIDDWCAAGFTTKVPNPYRGRHHSQTATSPSI